MCITKSVSLSVYPTVCLFACLFVYFFVCLSVFFRQLSMVCSFSESVTWVSDIYREAFLWPIGLPLHWTRIDPIQISVHINYSKLIDSQHFDHILPLWPLLNYVVKVADYLPSYCFLTSFNKIAISK